jgi:hypothetical protein
LSRTSRAVERTSTTAATRRLSFFELRSFLKPLR